MARRGRRSRGDKIIHYHGTPITPMDKLARMGGRNFCISYATPTDLKRCLQIGQMLMFDNGAFTTFTRGKRFDEDGYYRWLDPILGHPHWAVIPDVIDGSEEQQREMIGRWPYPKELGLPVWHMGLPIDYLLYLADNYPRLCFGSTAQYWQVGNDAWCHRMDEAFNALAKRHPRLPWIHGLRMLGMTGNRWPLASADSTNIAQNHWKEGCPECMAQRLDAVQTPLAWQEMPLQQPLFAATD